MEHSNPHKMKIALGSRANERERGNGIVFLLSGHDVGVVVVDWPHGVLLLWQDMRAGLTGRGW